MTSKKVPSSTPLQTWWMQQAQDELDMLMPKVVEYSSADLDIIGAIMLRLNPDLQGVVTPAEAGIAFYALGKTARIMGALIDGREPSRDSWLDLACYAAMALRTRDTGGEWPGNV